MLTWLYWFYFFAFWSVSHRRLLLLVVFDFLLFTYLVVSYCFLLSEKKQDTVLYLLWVCSLRTNCHKQIDLILYCVTSEKEQQRYADSRSPSVGWCLWSLSAMVSTPKDIQTPHRILPRIVRQIVRAPTVMESGQKDRQAKALCMLAKLPSFTPPLQA